MERLLLVLMDWNGHVQQSTITNEQKAKLVNMLNEHQMSAEKALPIISWSLTHCLFFLLSTNGQLLSSENAQNQDTEYNM